MTILHPWAVAAGLAAVGLPVAIHLLTRPRPRRLPLSTLRFVRQAVQQRRAAHRLRDWIILALRTLAVLLIATAFARPLLGTEPLVPAVAAGKTIRVVIVDQSQSMAASSNGIAAFERARAVTATYLPYQPEVQADLILAAAQPHASFPRPTSNARALRDELAAARVLHQRLNIQPALNLAGELLSAGSPDTSIRSELVIVSDFQRTNWAAADLSPLPKETVIQFESVAPKETPANLAVTRIALGGRVELGRPVRTEITIGNYSPAARDVKIEMTVGQAAYQLGGVCAPGVTTTLTTDIVPQETGWLTGNAKLIGADDALAADDQRPFVLDVRPPPVYVLVSRQPSRPQASSSHFLELALAPSAARDTAAGERVMRLDASQADAESLGKSDLIALDHPGKLSAATVDLLASLMRRGRPVLYVAAEAVDATNLKLLADAAGSDLKMPVEFVPPQPSQVRRGLFLAEIRKSESPFAVFGENLSSIISALRFDGGLDSRRLESGLVDDVLASYSDRSAALVVSACGAGTLAILNTDLGESNLRSSPAFVPLVGELVGRLLGRRQTADAVASGEPTALFLPPEVGAAASLRIVSPDGASADPGTLVNEGDFVAWRWTAAGPPGAYRVCRADHTVFAMASAVPADEADLRPLDPSILQTRLTGGRRSAFDAAGDEPQRKDHLWSWIALACGLCMIGELTALKVFST